MSEIIENWKNGNLAPPSWIQIHPTLKCNLHCYFCDNPKEANTSKEIPQKRLLQLIDEANEMKISSVIISGGGEPLIRKNVVMKMIRKIKRYGMNGCLLTNGALINSIDAKTLVKIKWDTIIFSLHASNPKLDNFIRGGKNAFERTINAIKKINFWKRKSHTSKPMLGMVMVITKDNYHDIENILKLAKKLEIRQVNLKMVNEHPDLFITKRQLLTLHSKIENVKKYAEREGINLIIEFSLKDVKNYTFNICNGGKVQNLCKVPFTEMVVFADGTVSQCCNFWRKENEFLDNVQNKTLKEIWYGEKFEKLREKIVKNDLPYTCQKCTLDFKLKR